MTSVTTEDEDDKGLLKHKRRYCRAEGCTKIVKSQGLCQRHGAKPRGCKVKGCPKQAQGNFDGMCKAHFKASKRAEYEAPKPDGRRRPPPPAEGQSVYDSVVPSSVGWKPSQDSPVMPLIRHLKEGFDAGKPPAWHRNEERRARGLWPVHNPATQLEGWERELVWFEILLLTGNADACFRHLARAWGRDKGFHMVLAQFICERHGDVERKKRKKGRRRRGSGGSNLAFGANIWDVGYDDEDYTEELAADILAFDPENQQENNAATDESETSEPGGGKVAHTHINTAAV